MALIEGRRFVGIEVAAAYFYFARKRIGDVVDQSISPSVTQPQSERVRNAA